MGVHVYRIFVNRFAKIVVLAISIPVVVVLLIASGGFIYFTATAKHEIYTEGTAYGFEIGQTKADAYSAALVQFEDGEITGIDSSELFVTILPSATRTGFDTLQSMDTWWLYCSQRKSFFDSITLSFDDGRLVEIRRQCCYELP